MAWPLLHREAMRALSILAFAMLIGTTSTAARADAEVVDPDVSVAVEEDAALDAVGTPTTDAGPLLPNGEPVPPPDLASDAGGCGCRSASAATTAPAALALVLALLLRRRKQPQA